MFMDLGTQQTSPEQITCSLACGLTFHHISLEFLVFLNFLPTSTALTVESKTNKTKLFSGNGVERVYLKMCNLTHVSQFFELRQHMVKTFSRKCLIYDFMVSVWFNYSYFTLKQTLNKPQHHHLQSQHIFQ